MLPHKNDKHSLDQDDGNTVAGIQWPVLDVPSLQIFVVKESKVQDYSARGSVSIHTEDHQRAWLCLQVVRPMSAVNIDAFSRASRVL